jgi:hypothetical protein
VIEQTHETKLSIAVIVGSVREPRVGRAVADWFAERAKGHPDLEIDLIDLALVDLPLTDTKPGGVPTSAISDRLSTADGYAVVTPEYNHSFPAGLKNAIDWHCREWMFNRSPSSRTAPAPGVRAQSSSYDWSSLSCTPRRPATASSSARRGSCSGQADSPRTRGWSRPPPPRSTS